MALYSIEHKDRVFAEGYGFLSFAKDVSKNTDKNVSKNLRSKYSQKLCNHDEQSATDETKTTSTK